MENTLSKELVLPEDKLHQVSFIVYASFEDLQAIENLLKEWKQTNNKKFEKIGVVDLKNVALVKIVDK